MLADGQMEPRYHDGTRVITPSPFTFITRGAVPVICSLSDATTL